MRSDRSAYGRLCPVHIGAWSSAGRPGYAGFDRFDRIGMFENQKDIRPPGQAYTNTKVSNLSNLSNLSRKNRIITKKKVTIIESDRMGNTSLSNGS